MDKLTNYFRTLTARPMVRPWALAVPILVLVLACPLLRPLRHPHPSEISSDEVMRLATIQAIVEHRSLDVHTAGTASGPYGFAAPSIDGIRQPPMLSILLSPTYWLMYRSGITMDSNATTVAYILTLLGVTLPVALAGGLVYRMGRFFELRRPWRTLLAFMVVFGSGLFSYSTVLNAHAPASALILAGSAALIHTAMRARSPRLLLFVMLAGFCFSLAATIDPPALIFLPLMAFVLLAFRWRANYRLVGLACYALGAAVVLLTHVYITGTVTDYFLPAELRDQQAVFPIASLPPSPAPSLEQTLLATSPDEPASTTSVLGNDMNNLLIALLGDHGLLTHFPILIMGLFGIAAVMHRHWALATKIFATATISATVVIIIGCVVWLVDWSDAMFAVRWFIVFTPLLLFWSGAWLRRHHRPATWSLVAALALFSVSVSLIGATYPLPRHGHAGYTAASAVHLMNQPLPADNSALAVGVR